MKDGLKQAGAQQRGQLQGIFLIALVAALHRVILTRVADEQVGNERSSQFKEPLGLCAFFKGQMKRAAQAAQEIADGRSLGLKDGLGDSLPLRSRTAAEMVA